MGVSRIFAADPDVISEYGGHLPRIQGMSADSPTALRERLIPVHERAAGRDRRIDRGRPVIEALGATAPRLLAAAAGVSLSARRR